ncbi:MAG: bifunctional folylpolyglutamate synthase/dihydrofolate synthase [Candidatus Hydrogenedentes bacterium]|nr:bifunctional folylpolyglutamate synthase/dihydrofolate synthase [Candidatus Hydrogenedentota bacterium]
MSGAPATRAGAREYLFGLAVHGVKLGLNNINALLDAAERPERRYPTIHVAGTNGKGSVIALLHAMFRAAGYRAGRFTSPHLIDLRERFQINSECISEEALEENTAFFRATASDFEFPPTFFEMNTAVAFRWFAQEHVDAALIEVGLGGRLDSTNVLTPQVCAITNIDLEHTEYLGDTLEKIAWEKAGILKPGVPVVIGETKPKPQEVILAQAESAGAPLKLLGQHFQYSIAGDVWRQELTYESPALTLRDAPLALAGRHQGANAAVAVALAETCRDRYPRLTVEAIRAGLATAHWPGRLERVLDHPPVIMDVAHNAVGAQRLAETLGQCVVVFAVASDKNAAAMLECLAPHADPLILTQFSHPRALPLEVLAAAAGSHAHKCVPELSDALAQGIALASNERPLLVTGSIYMAGEARQILMDQYGTPAPLF